MSQGTYHKSENISYEKASLELQEQIYFQRCQSSPLLSESERTNETPTGIIHSSHGDRLDKSSHSGEIIAAYFCSKFSVRLSVSGKRI